MSKDLFHELAAELVPYIAPNPSSPNYRLLDAEKSLEQLRQDRIDTDQLHISRQSVLRTASNCLGLSLLKSTLLNSIVLS